MAPEEQSRSRFQSDFHLKKDYALLLVRKSLNRCEILLQSRIPRRHVYFAYYLQAIEEKRSEQQGQVIQVDDNVRPRDSKTA